MERDVCEAQERATGLQTLWQNCKNDLVAARLDAASAQRQLTSERTKLRQTKDQVGDLMSKVILIEVHNIILYVVASEVMPLLRKYVTNTKTINVYAFS